MIPLYNLPNGRRGDTYLFPEIQLLNESDYVTSLEVGEDYLIELYVSGDYTTVGASENKTGEIFTATGTITSNSKVRKVNSYINITGAAIKAQLYKCGQMVLELDNFVILDALKGLFTYGDFIPTEYGVFDYDLQVKIGEVVKTYFQGAWTIEKDITV